MTKILYKFACFDCHVAFKRRASDDYSGVAHLAETEYVHPCPHCNRRMAFMGRNFVAPAKSDTSGWWAAKKLWEAGFRFVGNGYHADPALPRNKSEVDVFIQQNPRHALRVGPVGEWDG